MRMLATSRPSLGELGLERLRPLCSALGYEAGDAATAAEVFRRMAASWGLAPAVSPAQWASDITDDHTPFEFSLAIDGARPELRFLIEVLGAKPSIASNWSASLAMADQLAADHGAHLGRFRTVETLFAPTAACRRFALWYAVCFRHGAPPDFKMYLNPQAQGRLRARTVVATAMKRLGLGDAIAYLPSIGPRDELCYFSLDLSAQQGARVKVYTAHHDATLACVEAALGTARGYVPGQASEFCRAVGGSHGPFRARPVITCLAFVEGSARPTTGTVHFPVRSYARDDGVVRDRLLHYMHAEGAPIYQRALDAFADRRLEDGIGMQTYASLRLERGHQRVTVYLAPEAHDVGQVAMTEPMVSGIIATHGQQLASSR